MSTEGDEDSPYQNWISRFDVLRPEDHDSIFCHAKSIAVPHIVVILRFDQLNESCLQRALVGLATQIPDDWQAVLYFDSTCSARTVALARARAYKDQRLSVLTKCDQYFRQQLNDVGAIVFADGTIALREHALYMFSVAASDRATALVYSDEDKLDARGSRTSPAFKPDFSPELFANEQYLGHCIMLRGPTFLLQSAADQFLMKCHDVPELTDELLGQLAPSNVVHVPHILFHDTATHRPSGPRRRRPVPLISDVSVSIIIPTRDRVDLLRPCLDSIEAQTNYPRDLFEIVVVDNGSRDPETLRYLVAVADSKRIRLLHDAREFNFSKINNKAAAQCRSTVLVFLNNDTAVIEPTWLERLATYAVRSDIGAVGCTLLYPDGTVQHGGMVAGIRGSVVHAHAGITRGDCGFQALAKLTREVSAVTGACMAIRRTLFLELDGFDEQLAIAFNDTDLCFRALSQGYRNIVISDALAIHHECKTRGRDDEPQKIANFRKESGIARERHAKIFRRDPYYNQNLSVDNLYALASPPRRVRPWLAQRRSRAQLNILCIVSPQSAHHPASAGISAILSALLSRKHQVLLSFPIEDSTNFAFDCPRVVNVTPETAAVFSWQNNIDCIIVLDASFLSIALLIDEYPKVVCCDPGAPPDELFDDVRQDLEEHKALSFPMAHAVVSSPDGHGECFDSKRIEEYAHELTTLVEAMCAPRSDLRPVDLRATQLRPGSFGCMTEVPSRSQSVQDRRIFYAKLQNLYGDAFVHQLYLSVLGRYADHYGRRFYVEQLLSGAPRSRIIREVAHSPEAQLRGVNPVDLMHVCGLCDAQDQRTVYGIEGLDGRMPLVITHVPTLQQLHDDDFIYCVYVTVLGRLPDGDELRHYAQQLRNGIRKLEIIARVRYSAEGRKRGIRLKGCRMSLWAYGMRRLFHAFDWRRS